MIQKIGRNVSGTPMTADQERRYELRFFLMTCRSRLRPGDVGLPRTARRRVPGLRRDEVAELVGVSVDWYRWFESGRRVRVSPQLIARIAFVLQLSAYDELTMYRLALPEIYQACLRALTNTLRRQSGNDITIRVRRWIAGGRCCHRLAPGRAAVETGRGC